MEIEFIFTVNSKLTEQTTRQIIQLKRQYWIYPYDSQVQWMKYYMKPQDIHLLLCKKNVSTSWLIGYLALFNVPLMVDEETYEAYGIGTVCIDKEYRGMRLGASLMKRANQFLIDQRVVGILRCEDSLLDFYEKLGWQQIKLQLTQVFVSNELYIGNMLYFNANPKLKMDAKKVCLNKFF